MKVLYHNDFDGYASAAIVAKYHNELGTSFNKNDFIKVNYNKPINLENIWPNELVYIVDYSLKPEEWEMIQKNTSNLVWIDHHVSAIRKYNVLDRKLIGIRRDGTAACELTWEFFYPNKQIPYSIQLLGDYDVWKYKYGDETTYFQNGLKVYDTHPCSIIWDKLFTDELTSKIIHNDGITITSYIKKEYETIVKSYYFEVKFEGLNALVCNSHERRSTLFDSIYDEANHDIMIAFNFDGDNWVFSLYTTKANINCSIIATKYGGGGHKNAAGFTLPNIPWNKPRV